ncbi:uncharacterized protein [Panulirus ornatus]|uniref:uncharacterized protein isoform X2 n=1 Tax=Panulirus ornatus TaxID=150431 RepID=UPI003A88825A
MLTVENVQTKDCFICCKNPEAIDTVLYSSNHVLRYTKMSVVSCLKKALNSCLQGFQKGCWDLLLCLECDKIINDLDNFLHQYTETQAKLRLRYIEAHPHCRNEAKFDCSEDSKAKEKISYQDESSNDEIRFLQKLSDRSSSKRSIRSNPRYADVPPPRTHICSLCSEEHLTKVALEAHMEGAHNQKKPKRGRGRPRKSTEKGSLNFSVESLSKERVALITKCKIADDIALLKEEDCSILQKLQNCPIVDDAHYHKIESPPLKAVSQDLTEKTINTSENETPNIEQKQSILAAGNYNGDGTSHVELVLSANSEDYLLTASECDKFVKKKNFRKHLFTSAERDTQVQQSSNKKYMCQEKCPKCGKIFIGRTKLRKHMLLHSDSQEQKICEVCGRILHNATAHKVHMQRLHKIVLESSIPETFQSAGDKKKASCYICGKTYRGASGLSYHLAAKHNKGPRYPCDKCTRVFPHSRNLSSHKAQAHGSYSMICEHCGETFKLQTQLNSHINSIHRGITSWMCHLCPSKFSSHIDHRIHINKHKRLTYVCDICGKQYSWREALKKHKRTKHEYYESPVSDDCTAITSSLMSVNNPMREENRNDIAVLSGMDSEVSVEEIEIGPILSSGISLTNPDNEHNGLQISTTLAPVILEAKLVDQKRINSGPVLASVVCNANMGNVEKEINLRTHTTSVVSGHSSGSAEKEMGISPVIPVMSETNCEVDYDRVPDGNGLPLIISSGQNSMEKEPLINPVISSVVTDTCDDIFPHGESQGVTSGLVEEVVIVETDSSVNYDYIVYHVSD